MQASAKAEWAAVKERVTERHRDYLFAAGRLEEIETTLKNYATERRNGVESEFQAATEKSQKLKETLDALQQGLWTLFAGLALGTFIFPGISLPRIVWRGLIRERSDRSELPCEPAEAL